MTSKAIFERILRLYQIPDAYGRWSEYREELTDYIIHNTKPRKTMAILGVGASDDMDLERLYHHAGSLILADRDLHAMQEAVKKYGLEKQPAIQLFETDFLHISDAVYLNLISICKGDMEHMDFSMEQTGKKVIDYLSEVFEQIFSQEIQLGIGDCAYVVAVGLHSQLSCLMMQIWDIFLNMNGVEFQERESKDEVEAFLKRQNDQLIPYFCDALMKTAKEGLVIGVEDRVNDSDSRVQGAIQTIDYLVKRCGIKPDAFSYLLWPFREGVTYKMRLCVINSMI
ncbi:MAG: hypothetical protein PUD20_04255 [bacterium]|nr:hypothetical protein [bacterium]